MANGLAGAIALAGWRWTRVRGRVVWIPTIAAEAVVVVQVAAGVALYAGDDYPALDRIHMFYGFVAFLTVGLAYSYRQQMRDRTELLYGFVGLFLMGVGIRALMEVAA